jgi:hypothetical protein
MPAGHDVRLVYEPKQVETTRRRGVARVIVISTQLPSLCWLLWWIRLELLRLDDLRLRVGLRLLRGRILRLGSLRLRILRLGSLLRWTRRLRWVLLL